MSITLYGITIVVTWVLYVGFAVAIDTVFGLGRAIKKHCWNSSVGIDGAIRKISLLACMTFMVALDSLCGFNMVELFPEDVVTYLVHFGMSHVGFSEFFGILFVAYECVSILKNMYMCGLPVRWVWETVYKFLHKYTDELPDTEGIEIK